ncbi:hypothetical protein G6O69_27060 [Pseudenhygromyxa sp. WMMC2535]|uniref:hypothetical protein n=1 Tax=Pseudenhygromyxa sp. WMMC2535 TaxID=2712867 RepID=UPI0015582D8C|nr:hypothetical protein [Pseudenhygromyxa sp. WMMC2535]NVB41528.1 hypothetical protein [Pseudenhygromyxa sp. WMMC2535]
MGYSSAIPRALDVALCTLVSVLALAPASASPPAQPETPPPSIPRLIDEGGGFWLSVELIGPRGAQLEAAKSLIEDPVEDGLPRGGRPPPGELVGRVESLDQALAWVHRHAFDSPPLGFEEPGRDGPAPLPGGALLESHGLHLTALVVTAGAPSGGTRDYPWPGASATLLPEGLDWRPATLAVARTPLFAAPAPALPPASERYLEVSRDHDLWQVGVLDRCDDTGRSCLRWAQVITREGSRFHAGWLPNWLLVPDAAWVVDPDNPRAFALRAAHHELDRAGFVLIERQTDAEGERHFSREGLAIEHIGSSWPAASASVLEDTLTVQVGPHQLLSRPLEPLPTLPSPP